MTQNKSPEQIVREFYTSKEGWQILEDGMTKDAKLFEDLRDCAKDYVSACRLRILNYLPEQGEYLLDAASGPIQHPEYLEYSKNFSKRYCVDISNDALEIAKRKIGTDHGEFLNVSILDLDLPNDFFDAVICLHAIFHIDENLQEKAVCNLLRMVKKDQPVVIFYTNPNCIFNAFGKLNFLKAFVKKLLGKDQTGINLYYFAHPLSWWKKFEDIAEVEIYPQRTVLKKEAEFLIPNNIIGKNLLSILFRLESKYQKFFATVGTYITVVLTKK